MRSRRWKRPLRRREVTELICRERRGAALVLRCLLLPGENAQLQVGSVTVCLLRFYSVHSLSWPPRAFSLGK